MNKIKILLVDDHAVMRMGLASLLNAQSEFEVIGEAGDGESGLQLAAQKSPDVVVMDLMMSGIDGVEATRRLVSQDPTAKILILTTFGTADGISHALRSGAKGAIMKSADFSEFKSAILAIARGENYIESEIEQMMLDDPPVPLLSHRQSEILQSITRGLSNEDIAKQFNISLQMVKGHLTALFAKIGAANRAEAVSIALRKHLLKI